MSPITDSLPPSEIPCWRRPTVKRTALCSAHGNRMQTATRCSGEITRRTMNIVAPNDRATATDAGRTQILAQGRLYRDENGCIRCGYTSSCSSNGALSLTMNTLTPYPTKATVRSSMPTKRKFRTASSENIRRSRKRKRLHRATLTAAVRLSWTAPRTSRRERSRKIRTEAASPSVPHRRKKKLLPT